MNPLRRFGSFWWDFIVGDDWRLALSAAAALAITGLAVTQEISAWWITPVLVTAALVTTVRAASKRIIASEPRHTERGIL
jgi:hypothetical protein